MPSAAAGSVAQGGGGGPPHRISTRMRVSDMLQSVTVYVPPDVASMPVYNHSLPACTPHLSPPEEPSGKGQGSGRFPDLHAVPSARTAQLVL
eukprot:COSAG04_NODE_24863_length_315_cov_5.787037_1_plen_91_part_10